jgi:general secretion pathway protein J
MKLVQGLPTGRRARASLRYVQRGFTLIELMVAITVLAIMAGLSWRSLDGMFRTQSSTRQYADQVLVLQTVLAQWQADWDQVTETGLVSAADYDGKVLRLTRLEAGADAFSTTAAANAVNKSSSISNAATASAGIRVVAWTVGVMQGQSVWLRWQSERVSDQAALMQAWQNAAHWANKLGNAPVPPQYNEVKLLPLSSWQLVYYRNDAWVNPLSSASNGSTTGSGTQSIIPPPDGVRLILDLPAEAVQGQSPALTGRIQRDWVNPKWSAAKS